MSACTPAYAGRLSRYRQLNAQPELHEPESLDAQLAFDRLVHVCQYFSGRLDPREYLCIWLQVGRAGAMRRAIRPDPWVASSLSLSVL